VITLFHRTGHLSCPITFSILLQVAKSSEAYWVLTTKSDTFPPLRSCSSPGLNCSNIYLASIGAFSKGLFVLGYFQSLTAFTETRNHSPHGSYQETVQHQFSTSRLSCFNHLSREKSNRQEVENALLRVLGGFE
jgi:hypothetical protein